MGTSVGHDLLKHTKETDYSGDTQLCKLRLGIGCLDGYELSNLGQTIYNYLDGIVS
jgi:hypothetical protein